MDTIIYFGDAVKALDENGRVGALGIRFSDGTKKDLANEFFTAKTYLGPSDGDGQECTFDHGFPVAPGLDGFADHTFAPVKARRDPLGVWVETVLDLSDEYEKAVFQLAKKGKLGWSSGAAGHRVKKDAKTGEIKSWPVAEWALTPRPCEPENYGTALPLKSLASVKFVDLENDELPTETIKHASIPLAAKLNQLIEDRVDDGLSRADFIKRIAKEAGVEAEKIEAVLTGATKRPPDAHLKAIARVLDVDFSLLRELTHGMSQQTIKGIFEEQLAESGVTRWQLDSAFCDVVRKLANVAASTMLTGVDFDLKGKLHEAIVEYMNRLEEMALAQITEYVSSGSDEPFYLKAIVDLSSDLPVSGNLDLDDHSLLAVSALKDVTKRFRVNHESRLKAGRVLSQTNRNRIATMLEQIEGAVADCRKLLDESQPMASDTEKRAAMTEILRRQHRARQLGITASQGA